MFLVLKAPAVEIDAAIPPREPAESETGSYQVCRLDHPFMKCGYYKCQQKWKFTFNLCSNTTMLTWGGKKDFLDWTMAWKNLIWIAAFYMNFCFFHIQTVQLPKTSFWPLNATFLYFEILSH